MNQIILPEFHFIYYYDYNKTSLNLYQEFNLAFINYESNELNNIKELNQKDKIKIKEYIHCWIGIAFDDYCDGYFDWNNILNNDNEISIETYEKKNNNNDEDKFIIITKPALYEFNIKLLKYYINLKINIIPL